MGLRSNLICCLSLISLQRLTLGDGEVQFTVARSDGTQLSSPASEPVDSQVRLTCSFTPPFDGFNGALYVVAGPTNVTQASCTMSNSQAVRPATSVLDIVGGTTPISGGRATINTASCSSTSFTFSIKMLSEMPARFFCYVTDFADPDTKRTASFFLLHSNIAPTVQSIIAAPVEMFEGTPATFTCSGAAKPQPKLRFKLGNDIQDGPVMVPSVDTISDDSPNGQSNLTWTTNMVANMNGKTLVCEVFDHPSKQSASSSLKLNIFFGPNDNKTESVSHNLASGSSLPVLQCSGIDSNPTAAFTWYRGNSASGSAVSGSQSSFTVPQSDLQVSAGQTAVKTYVCIGTNSKTGKWAQKLFTLTVTNVPRTTTTDSGVTQGGSTDQSAEPMQALMPWHIALIVIGCVAALVIIVVIIVCCVRKRNNSPKQKKAAAARADQGQGQGYINNKYQASTSSLHQADAIRTNYSENPTLPADYRHSSQGQYMEQYSEVFDSKPRSRKPVALEELELHDGGPPSPAEAPPAYNQIIYRDDYSYSSYGAPC